MGGVGFDREENRSEDEAAMNLHGKGAEVSSVGGDCNWCVFEVFEAARQVQLSFCCWSEGLGYVLEIDAAPEATRP